ncbi:MAG: flagellar biosynthetic protein FliO [Lachnospiraceae bacterium]|nr:flagellar biosynthetic protein FliO [Lachnospiraceae bacterium]
MTLVLSGSGSSYAQLITVLVVFVLVLGVTAITTKWIADYQKQQGINCNIEVIETTRISNTKYIQIIRVGEKYMVIAVCKDTVTMLGEVPKEQLKEVTVNNTLNFKELFEHAMKKDSSNESEPKEDVK